MTANANRHEIGPAAAPSACGADGMPMAAPCPLCGDISVRFHADARRPYLRCPTCALIHVPPQYHLHALAEKAVYDQHDNRPDDPHYRRFLARAADAVTARLAAPATGLDFGAGPGPTLSVMLAEQGYAMTDFDPYFAPDPDALTVCHDFITATEVFEHLARPRTELERLTACLRPGGWLIVMTKRHQDDVGAFARWHYIHDPTHVAFFSEHTFAWIAGHFRMRLQVVGPDVVALQQSMDDTPVQAAPQRI